MNRKDDRNEVEGSDHGSLKEDKYGSDGVEMINKKQWKKIRFLARRHSKLLNIKNIKYSR